jgi:hypothetical protein
MNELTQALIAESYAAQPSHILEGLNDNLVHHEFPNVPHTIYDELWHVAFWQRITLHWIAGIETPYPTKASDGFPPKPTELAQEPWEQLRHRFLHGAEHAASGASSFFASFCKRGPQPQAASPGSRVLYQRDSPAS